MNMKRWKITILMALSLALILFTVMGCNPEIGNQANQADPQSVQEPGVEPDHSEEEQPAPPEPVQEPEPTYKEAKLTAVGDIMMHLPQIYSGFDSKTRTYNFDSFFTEVRDRLSTGDWVIGNLETPLAHEDPRGYTGYPEFNAPPELADAIAGAGFNILTTANNHSLDRRERGVLRTLENVKARGLLPIGTAASPEEAEQIHLVTHNEISMAVMAYTYGTNGIPIPEGKSYLVSLIDEAKIIADIKKARELKADVVTVVLHFGNEYQPLPTEEQQKLVQSLFRAGADIVLGSHPHVLQPYQVMDVTRDDGTLAKGIVIYSMGNFVSNQDRIRNNKKPTDVGVIFEIGIRKRFPDGLIEYTGVEAIPTYVHKRLVNGKQQYRVLQLESVLAARTDALLTDKDYERLEGYFEEAVAHLGSMAEPAAAGQTAVGE